MEKIPVENSIKQKHNKMQQKKIETDGKVKVELVRMIYTDTYIVYKKNLTVQEGGGEKKTTKTEHKLQNRRAKKI